MKPLMAVFVIAALGYILGNIKIAGLKFGTSGVILVALVFGHFGFDIPPILKDLGLVLFVGSVGLIAGPVFFKGFKKQALPYIVISVLIIGAGAATAIGAIKLLNIPMPLGVGIMYGALTSTPGLGAAIEATGSDLASIGYGVAYPFGVIGSVLFVQLIPLLGNYNMEEESRKLDEKYGIERTKKANERPLKYFSGSDMLVFSIVMIVGFVIGDVTVPLPGGSSFNLGTSGGPLLAGLIFGHIGRIGDFSITIPKKTLETFREFGLMLFLLGAGVSAGEGFISVVAEHGIKLFVAGAVITVSAITVGYLVAAKIFKLSLFDALGCVCGGNTSTPSLGALLNVAQNDNVVAPYAATYPIALACVVIVCQVVVALAA